MKKILFAAPLQLTSSVKLGGYHYAKQFNKKGWEVFYFSNPLSLFNLCFSNDRMNISERASIYKRGGIFHEKIWSYVPLTLIPHHNRIPVLNNKIFLDNYYRFTVPSIRSIIRTKKCDRVDILWIDCSNQLFWSKILTYKKLVYRIPDNFLSSKNKCPATISAHYELLEKSDLILMPSKLLINLLSDLRVPSS
jgi:hypothetical protein